MGFGEKNDDTKREPGKWEVHPLYRHGEGEL